MIKQFSEWLVFGLLNLSKESSLGSSLEFFIYDTVKILLLLILITHIMGIINYYFPVEKVKSFLKGKNLFGFENLLASLLGAVTPFCSCSSIPLFIGFVKGGIPLGVTLSFLITSPLINEVALTLFISIFGWKVTLIYMCTGIMLGTLGGLILGKMNLEKHLTPWVQNMQDINVEYKQQKTHLFNHFSSISSEAFGIMKGIYLYVLIGVALGAVIHGYVPQGFFEAYITKSNPLAVPLSVILGIPMYANASGIIPVVQAFVAKGIPLGTALAFMMAVVGLSFPEAMMLKKVMNGKLMAIFFGSVGLAIIISGYMFNIIL